MGKQQRMTLSKALTMALAASAVRSTPTTMSNKNRETFRKAISTMNTHYGPSKAQRELVTNRKSAGETFSLPVFVTANNKKQLPPAANWTNWIKRGGIKAYKTLEHKKGVVLAPPNKRQKALNMRKEATNLQALLTTSKNLANREFEKRMNKIETNSGANVVKAVRQYLPITSSDSGIQMKIDRVLGTNNTKINTTIPSLESLRNFIKLFASEEQRSKLNATEREKLSALNATLNGVKESFRARQRDATSVRDEKVIQDLQRKITGLTANDVELFSDSDIAYLEKRAPAFWDTFMFLLGPTARTTGYVCASLIFSLLGCIAPWELAKRCFGWAGLMLIGQGPYSKHYWVATLMLVSGKYLHKGYRWVRPAKKAANNANATNAANANTKANNANTKVSLKNVSVKTFKGVYRWLRPGANANDAIRALRNAWNPHSKRIKDAWEKTKYYRQILKWFASESMIVPKTLFQHVIRPVYAWSTGVSKSTVIVSAAAAASIVSVIALLLASLADQTIVATVVMNAAKTMYNITT